MANIKDRINEMKAKKAEPKITHAKPKEFSEKIRNKAKNIKRFIALLTMIGVQIVYAGHSQQNPEYLSVKLMDNARNQKTIVIDSVEKIAEMKTEQLQEQILSNVDSLQRLIVQAGKTGAKNKTKVVKKILDDVFPRGGLPGTTNYCVAGAAKARMMCNDTTLNAIMPDPTKLPKEYGFSSSPNVSCPFMRQYFKNTLGENYADRKSENFNEVVNSLEAGDVIMVRSSSNTSSGEHCVTVSGPMQEDGTIPVMSLNKEDNYNVSPKQIVGAAKVIAQYRQRVKDTLNTHYKEDIEQCLRSGLVDSQEFHKLLDTALMMKLMNNKVL